MEPDGIKQVSKAGSLNQLPWAGKYPRAITGKPVPLIFFNKTKVHPDEGKYNTDMVFIRHCQLHNGLCGIENKKDKKNCE